MLRNTCFILSSLVLTTLVYSAADSGTYKIISTSNHVGSPAEWHESEEPLKIQYERGIEAFADVVTFVGKSNLPQHKHKVIRIGAEGSRPTCINLLIVAAEDAIREKMLLSIAPIQPEQLNLGSTFAQFAKQVGSLKKLSFFAALFSFRYDRTRWALEVGNQSFMHTVINPDYNSDTFYEDGLLKCNIDSLRCIEFWSQCPIRRLKGYCDSASKETIARERKHFIETRTEKEAILKVDYEKLKTCAGKYLNAQDCSIL